ncbi:MAG: hypothetical protein AB7N76_13635 [Planctomycetota bacterium]
MKTLEQPLPRLKNALGASLKALGYLEGSTPHEVVARRGPARLRRYVPETPRADAVPALVITPIINRYRVVDLQPDGSLVGSLLAAGIPVYVVDWGQPARIDQGTDWEDYVLGTLPRFARQIGEHDTIGYCLGGTIAVIYAATRPAGLRKLVTLAAPVDFHCGQPLMDLLGLWVQPEAFPVEKLTGAFGNMPHPLIAQGFVWQKPLAAANKLPSAWERFDDAAFADFWAVLESWNNDGVDVPGAAYRRLIKDLYRDNLLAQGRFLLRGRPVDLGRIDHPLLVVTAAGDTTCPPAAANALLGKVSSRQKEELPLRGGHLTAIVGPKAVAGLHRPLAAWLLGEPGL